MIENDAQLANTLRKLQLLEEHIAQSRRQEADSPEQDQSLEALEDMARQLKEEMVRYRSRMKLKSAG
jgi:hypothetical protein